METRFWKVINKYVENLLSCIHLHLQCVVCCFWCRVQWRRRGRCYVRSPPSSGWTGPPSSRISRPPTSPLPPPAIRPAPARCDSGARYPSSRCALRRKRTKTKCIIHFGCSNFNNILKWRMLIFDPRRRNSSREKKKIVSLILGHNVPLSYFVDFPPPLFLLKSDVNDLKEGNTLNSYYWKIEKKY